MGDAPATVASSEIEAVLAAIAGVSEKLEAIESRLDALERFEALLEQYRPALEMIDKRMNRATRWKGRNGAGT